VPARDTPPVVATPPAAAPTLVAPTQPLPMAPVDAPAAALVPTSLAVPARTDSTTPGTLSSQRTAAADAGDKLPGPSVTAGLPATTAPSIPAPALTPVTPVVASAPASSGVALGHAAPGSSPEDPQWWLADDPVKIVGSHGLPSAPVASTPMGPLPSGTAALLAPTGQPAPATPFTIVPNATDGSWAIGPSQTITTAQSLAAAAGDSTSVTPGSAAKRTLPPAVPRDHRSPGDGKSPSSPGPATGSGASASGAAGSASSATGALALLLFAAGMCWASWRLLVATVRWRSLTLLLLLERPG
jgi:S-DNA-T family DNA segregation ATPase FtsK/SpoIIIE